MDITIYYYSAGIVVLLVLLLLISRRAGWSITEIRQVVAALVEAAEQMIPDDPNSDTGDQKLNWVLAKADEIGLTKYLSATLLRVMIEASVLWVNRSKPLKANSVAPTRQNSSAWVDRG